MAIETRWTHTASPDIAKLCEESKGVCVIPVGCIEKHGLHLPLGQDIIQASAIAYEASKLETAAVFPNFHYGDVSGQSPNMPTGTVNIPYKLRNKLLLTLCEQASRWGFKKILVFNGHGGNDPWLSSFQRILANEKRDFVMAYSTVSLPALRSMGQYLEENGTGSIPELTAEDEEYLIECNKNKIFGGHACLGETAHMMGIAPEAVHLERLGIETGISNGKTDYLSKEKISIPMAWDIDYCNNYAGEDHKCNERIGKASVRFAAEKFAVSIKAFKEDETATEWFLNKWQKGW